MDDFALVKTLRAAIYGKVALVRHRASGVVYAMKVMSLAHMAAQRAIAGPVVCEDGHTELRVLRRISGNRVVVGAAVASAASACACGHACDGSSQQSDVDRSSWSAHPTWGRRGMHGNSSVRLDHHHLLTLHTDFVDERANARCLVFDYCPYGELYDQLQRAPNQTLGLETARTFFKQITTAVRYLHTLNIAHRDLSLENVLVDAHRQCRLGDFGLACEYGTMCSGRVGKAFYMAPEVYDWQPDEFYDGLKADLWSLGIILFILATGAPPFGGAHEIDARFRVVKANGIRELLSVWKLDEKLPYELCDLLEMLLRVDPEDRVDIERVWSHTWLIGAADSHDLAWNNLVLPGRDPVGADDNVEKGIDDEDEHEHGEPQEEMETDATYGGATKKRQRKRIKISIEDCSTVAAAASTGRVAGFFGGTFADDEVMLARVGPPPTLRHEQFDGDSSPDGSNRRAVQPQASPIVWPKVGAQTAQRSLFPPDKRSGGGDGTEAVDAQDPETKDVLAACTSSTVRRRPRLESSSSSSSTSSLDCDQHDVTAVETSEQVADDTTELPMAHNGAHMCRFCLQWVPVAKCDNRVTLPTHDRVTSTGEPRAKTRRVCDACFLVVSAALVGGSDSNIAGGDTPWLYGTKRHAPQAA